MVLLLKDRKLLWQFLYFSVGCLTLFDKRLGYRLFIEYKCLIFLESFVVILFKGLFCYPVSELSVKRFLYDYFLFVYFFTTYGNLFTLTFYCMMMCTYNLTYVKFSDYNVIQPFLHLVGLKCMWYSFNFSMLVKPFDKSSKNFSVYGWMVYWVCKEKILEFVHLRVQVYFWIFTYKCRL